MKNVVIKKFLAILVVVTMLFSVYSIFANSVNARPIMENVPLDKYKFNAQDILEWAAKAGAQNGIGHTSDEVKAAYYPIIPVTITEEDLTSKKTIKIIEAVNKENEGHVYFDATDAAAVKKATSLGDSNEVNLKKNDSFGVINTLSKGLEIDEEDITVKYTIEMPKYGDVEARDTITYAVKSVEKDGEKVKTIQLSDEKINEYKNIVKAYNTEIETALDTGATKPDDYTFLSVKAEIAGDSDYAGAVYQVAGSKDEAWYLIRTTEPTPKADFKTILEYASTPEGKMNTAGDTFLPPYYENENKDAKKDVDATAIIKSKTEEGIVKTNDDVALTDENTKDNPNSLGWYYPDVTDKTKIAKDYPFDKYNNPTDNGAVKETVKLTGSEGGEDTQTPSIAWTLRRINYEEKTNDDKSITVTITYNLPIDGEKIPEGWTAITDDDGGIRKITRTFKEGEEYDKDVIVEQNGPSTATVTTPVKVTWGKAPTIQAGNAMNIVLCSILVLAGVAVVSYRKFRK